MLKRYTLPAMEHLWSETSKFQSWLDVEIAVLRAREELGDLDPTLRTADRIEEAAKFDVVRIEEIEAEVQHDMIAFVKCVQESLEREGMEQFKGDFHKHLTSYDVEDPALILQLRSALNFILAELRNLHGALVIRAREHQWTLMIARTHGQFAEPTTFGHLLLVYARAVERSILRLEHIRETELGEGKISGAVGNYATVSPELEARALSYLGLKPAKAETQILQRDRHAMLLSAISVAGGTIEQMAKTLHLMTHSLVREIREPRKQKQRGSSSMAGKKNPIKLEQCFGLARVLRGYASAACEDIATLEFRDISQSSVERHILSGATSLLLYHAATMTKIVAGMEVFPDRMRKNLEASQGVWAGHGIRTALMEKGVDYDVAYEYIQRCSFEAADQDVHLTTLLGSRPLSDTDSRTAYQALNEATIVTCFDAEAYVRRGIEHMFENVPE